jgi:hypothetical protein
LWTIAQVKEWLNNDFPRRDQVMKHGLMDRFKAMEDVGRMWQRQARLGIAELQRADGRE